MHPGGAVPCPYHPGRPQTAAVLRGGRAITVVLPSPLTPRPRAPSQYYNREGKLEPTGKSLRGTWPGGPLSYFSHLMELRDGGAALDDWELSRNTHLPSSL